jgi:hypothetical protein
VFVNALVARISSAMRHINETSGYGEITISIEKGFVKRIRVTTTENCEPLDVTRMSERDALIFLGGNGQASYESTE